MSSLPLADKLAGITSATSRHSCRRLLFYHPPLFTASYHVFHFLVPPLSLLFSLLSLTRLLLTVIIADILLTFDIFLFRSPHFPLPRSFDIPGTSFSLHAFIPTFL